MKDITVDRLVNFNHEVGEEFIDQLVPSINDQIFGGFLLCKHPDKASDILSILNSKSCYTQKFMDDLYWESDDADDNLEAFYADFCEFVNLTGTLKARVNEALEEVENPEV